MSENTMNNPSSRVTLLKAVSPINFQTLTAEAVLSSVGSTAEVVLQGKTKPFWVTD